ncbi:MAG TPA: ATP-binding protein [Methanoregula sp.]|nr:ATP-binding protein [Methanoregula sp.]
MNASSGFTGIGSLLQPRVSQTDLIRSWVIGSITVSIIGITFISMAAGFGTVVPQLFYFPILYTAYFYPDRSKYLAGCCAVAYLIVSVPFITPDFMHIGGILFQSLLFIGIAAGAGYILKNRECRMPAVPQDEPGTIREMLRTGECDHVEFKLQSLWSSDLTKEEIAASESADVRKYRNNASKFIIARSIAGFLNTDGGDLIIGIQEDRLHNVIKAVGIDRDYDKLHETDRNPDGYRRMLIDAVVRKYLPDIYSTASRFIHISFPVVSGMTVCHIHITSSDKPIFVDTGSEEIFFIRIDASTRSITGKNMTRYIINRFSSG